MAHKKNFAERAQRFAIEMPMRYRLTGATDWNEGITVNISTSGILYRAEKALQPQTSLDITITLPVAISGEAPAEIGCRATVVRAESRDQQDKQHHVAVSVLRYQFMHKRRRPDREMAAR